jgi:hypothetical protein
VFHAIHNTLAVTVPRWGESSEGGLAARLFGGEHPIAYQIPATVACSVGALAILAWFHSLSYRRTPEEQLEEARQRQANSLVGA